MKNLVITFGILISVLSVFGQQDENFNQYTFNKLSVNPGYTFDAQQLDLIVAQRNQWVGVEGAPTTTSASLQTPMFDNKVNIGGTFFSDKLGALERISFLGSYSYKLKLNKKFTLSLGLQAGFIQTNINNSKLHQASSSDPLLQENKNGTILPDANVGVYLYSEKFYVGLSSKHLINSESLIKNTFEKPEETHFYGIIGAAIPLTKDKNFVFRPSMLTKYVNDAPVQFDFDASFLINKKIWVGAGFRTKSQFKFHTQLNITKNISAGYSYDINALNKNLSKLRGSHEIMLKFNIKVRRTRIVSPRYF